MLFTDIMWVENLVGGSTKMKTGTVGLVAVKTGDVLKEGATDNVLIPIIAVDSEVVGVALHDAAAGAEIKYIPAYPWNVFAIPTSTGCEYDDSANKFNMADFTVFTSGAMAIGADTLTNGDVLMLGLADGESDDTEANVVLCIFMDTPYTNTGR